MFKGGILDFGYPRVGPMALPGEYKIKLKVGDQVLSDRLLLLPDPRQGFEEADLREQLAFALNVSKTITELSRSVEKIRLIRKQLEEHQELLEGKAKAEDLIRAAHDLQDELDQIEGKLHNTEAVIAYDILALKGGAKLYARLDAISLWVNSADGAPPQGLRELFMTQKKEVEGCRRELESFIAVQMAEYNQKASGLSFPIIYLGSG
jgi:hypothetical protein